MPRPDLLVTLSTAGLTWTFNEDTSTDLCLGHWLQFSEPGVIVGASYLGNVGDTQPHLFHLWNYDLSMKYVVAMLPRSIPGGEGAWAWVRCRFPVAWRVEADVPYQFVWEVPSCRYATAPGTFFGGLDFGPIHYFEPAFNDGFSDNGTFIYSSPLARPDLPAGAPSTATAYGFDLWFQPYP